MTFDPQITELLNRAQAGDEEAVTGLFEYYYPRLVRYAQKQIAGSPQQRAGPDDVAASAIRSFYKAAEAGRFPDLKDRDSLWRLSAEMTYRKAVDYWRREKCEAAGSFWTLPPPRFLRKKWKRLEDRESGDFSK